nr:MAG TPA: hypothetical protein [Caudoviricetes sp.]
MFFAQVFQLLLNHLFVIHNQLPFAFLVIFRRF